MGRCDIASSEEIVRAYDRSNPQAPNISHENLAFFYSLPILELRLSHSLGDHRRYSLEGKEKASKVIQAAKSVGIDRRKERRAKIKIEIYQSR
jgi:hypothetical protein